MSLRVDCHIDGSLLLNAGTRRLVKLKHENIVRIFGYCLGKPMDSREEGYMMALEYCHSDLYKLVFGTDPVYPAQKLSQSLQLKLMQEVSLRHSCPHQCLV